MFLEGKENVHVRREVSLQREKLQVCSDVQLWNKVSSRETNSKHAEIRTEENPASEETAYSSHQLCVIFILCG